MAIRKPAVKAVAVRKRKSHGPKRHLFASYGAMKNRAAKAGLLSKYCDIESFTLAAAARGYKGNIGLLWGQYSILPTKAAKDEFLKNLANAR